MFLWAKKKRETVGGKKESIVQPNGFNYHGISIHEPVLGAPPSPPLLSALL